MITSDADKKPPEYAYIKLDVNFNAAAGLAISAKKSQYRPLACRVIAGKPTQGCCCDSAGGRVTGLDRHDLEVIMTALIIGRDRTQGSSGVRIHKRMREGRMRHALPRVKIGFVS